MRSFNLIPGKTTLLSTLLLVLIAGSIGLTRNLLTTPTNEKANQPTTPDAFMTGMRYTQFDLDGKWKSSFDAEHMVHYSAEDTALFDKPRLVSRDQHRETWIISANHSTNKHGGNTVYLKDNVQIQRFDATNQKNLDLTTTAMIAYPNRHIIETNQPVIITQPGTVVHAIGMTANMDTGDVHLLSATNGVYQKTAEDQQPAAQ
jgi:LPS export ABC transporter protein LptC